MSRCSALNRCRTTFFLWLVGWCSGQLRAFHVINEPNGYIATRLGDTADSQMTLIDRTAATRSMVHISVLLRLFYSVRITRFRISFSHFFFSRVKRNVSCGSHTNRVLIAARVVVPGRLTFRSYFALLGQCRIRKEPWSVVTPGQG